MTRQQQIEAGFAPLIAAAARAEAEAGAGEAARRDAALVDAPHLVCGIPLRAMTMADYLALIVAGNAHVTIVEPPADPVAALRFWTRENYALLWLLSPHYRPVAAARDAFLAEHVGRLPFSALVAGINDYLRETFADAPRAASSRHSSEGATADDPIGCSFVVHWQHRLAAAYGWSRAEIRALPLKELFQILRLLDAESRLRSGRALRAPLHGEVDRLWAEMLRRINALNPAA